MGALLLTRLKSLLCDFNYRGLSVNQGPLLLSVACRAFLTASALIPLSMPRRSSPLNGLIASQYSRNRRLDEAPRQRTRVSVNRRVPRPEVPGSMTKFIAPTA